MTVSPPPIRPAVYSMGAGTAGVSGRIVLAGPNNGAQQGTGYVLVPVNDLHRYQITPGATATATITQTGGTSKAKPLALLAGPAPVISSMSPATAAAGTIVVLTGDNFGSQQGSGYVRFSNSGVNWGQPGDQATFQLLSWSNTQISFFVPVKDSQGYQIVPGVPATVTVTQGGSTSAAKTLALLAAPTPVISSISPATAAPGATIVINGQNFGTRQWTGYILFADNRVNWGQPGDQATFQVLNWSNTQITFLVPVKDARGYQVTPGTPATVTVTNGTGGLTSNTENLALHTAVTWPVTISSGVTSIGTTGNGFVQTTGTINQTCTLTVNTEVWDNSSWGIFTGFHAATVVRLYDTVGDTIGTYPAGPFGVEGGQNNANPWTTTIPAATCAALYSVSVVNFYDPQYGNGQQGVLQWIDQNASTIASLAKVVAGL